jgi:SAM-dependent methyltransferase
MPKLRAGERPIENLTPDSILALHAAGYRVVTDRLGTGTVLDLGCGLGLGSAGLLGPDRSVIGADYSIEALVQAGKRFHQLPLHLACMDATRLSLSSGSVDWICSSHLIEHFEDPASHSVEVSRVLASTGTAFFLTPNAPADFENPFHVHLFEALDLEQLLSRHFGRVWVGGLDGSERVKEDFRARRRRAQRVLALDPLALRKRIPRSWYVRAYTTLLPIAYRILSRRDTGGATGLSADDFFVSDAIDDSTPVLLAIAEEPCRRPR